MNTVHEMRARTRQSISRIPKMLDQLTYNFAGTSSFGRNVSSVKSGQSTASVSSYPKVAVSIRISIDSFACVFFKSKLLHRLYFEVDIQDAMFVASDLELSSKTLVGHTWGCPSISWYADCSNKCFALF